MGQAQEPHGAREAADVSCGPLTPGVIGLAKHAFRSSRPTSEGAMAPLKRRVQRKYLDKPAKPSNGSKRAGDSPVVAHEEKLPRGERSDTWPPCRRGMNAIALDGPP
jgi:hypothetical protein